MKTRYEILSRENNNTEIIEHAGRIIRAGGLVAFPTETVYGLGGDALNPASSKKIYAAKGRPSDNPLIVHIADMHNLPKLAAHIPECAMLLAERFWPGPLTMIFQKSDIVPYETTGGLDTVAVRFPSDSIAKELIKAAGGFVAAPSANISGRPSPTSGSRVREDLSGRIDMILDGGSCAFGLESTIIDLTDEVPVILRPGFITEELLQKLLQRVDTDRAVMAAASSEAPKAPGMKYRHYAPKGKLTIVSGEERTVVSYINSRVRAHLQKGEKAGVIAAEETIRDYVACVKKNIGSRTDEAAAAGRLYEILRAFDDEEVSYIYAEAFDESGIGQAIMNRLLKAAGHNIIYL